MDISYPAEDQDVLAGCLKFAIFQDIQRGESQLAHY